MPSEPRDETPKDAAERCAEAISAYIAMLSHRIAHGPMQLVPDEERVAFATMRDELHNLASHEYDRGYRRAMAGKRTTEAG